MVYNTTQIFKPETYGVTAYVRPWIVAMQLTGSGSVLIEQELGDNVWVQVAPAYTNSSQHHVVEVTKSRQRIRITPSGGAVYEVTNE